MDVRAAADKRRCKTLVSDIHALAGNPGKAREVCVTQAWVNDGPLGFLIRPAELVQIIFKYKINNTGNGKPRSFYLSPVMPTFPQ